MDRKTLITRGAVLVAFLCIGLALWLNTLRSHRIRSISFEELYNNGDISIMGVDCNTSKAEFEEMMGMPYSKYLTKMDDAKINDQLEPYAFLFEEMPAVCLVRFEDESVENFILYFINEDALSPEEWVSATDSLIQKLKNVSTNTKYWTYALPNAEVRLELSALNVDGNGTAIRVSEMWISFHKQHSNIT